MKDKFRYLFKNMGLLFVSNFASKFLVFLLVPFYTSILTTAEYGTYDLFYTTIQMLVPILSLNIVDSVMRFSIDANKEDQKTAFTAGVKCVSLSIVLIVVGTWLVSSFIATDIFQGYAIPFVILFVSYILQTFFSQFSRGIEDVAGVAIGGIIGTVVMIAFNLLFLLVMGWGLTGYFYAMILSLIIPAGFLFVRGKMWRYLILDKSFFTLGQMEKDMLKYCVPLIFINLSWYINNVSDRYVVTAFCGLEANGVYSISYKIPSILNALQVVFIQAWQLSAVKEFNSNRGELFYRRTYQGCQMIMVILCSFLIAGTRVLANILFAKDFYEAWIYVPVLLLYIVFNTLSGTVGGIFSATKDAKGLTIPGLVGAAVNIGLNFVFVYAWGPIGAAIATVISSFVIWIMRIRASRKHMVLQLNYKLHAMQYILLTVQAAMMIAIDAPVQTYIVQAILFAIIVLSNLKELRSIKNGTV